MATIELWGESRAQREDGRYLLARFDEMDAARAAATQRLVAQLQEFRKPGQTASQLVELWLLFGDDCFLVPPPPGGFSSTQFVREQAMQLVAQVPQRIPQD